MMRKAAYDKIAANDNKALYERRIETDGSNK